MKKITTIIILFFTIFTVSYSEEGKSQIGSKLHITSDIQGATIFIDGEKKDIIFSGSVTFAVSSGNHKVRIFKHTQEWNYEGTKEFFVHDKSSSELYIRTKAIPTQYRIDKTNKLKIRQPLKAKENSKKFTIHNNGTATDNITKLEWMRCALGQTWKGKTCVGKAKKYTWQKAKDIAKTTDFAGYSDWRLPSIVELHTIVYCSNGKQRKFKKIGYQNIKHEGARGCQSNIRGDYQKPTINSLIFPNTLVTATSGFFWSSYTAVNKNLVTSGVYFAKGVDYPSLRIIPNEVRLVRASKPYTVSGKVIIEDKPKDTMIIDEPPARVTIEVELIPEQQKMAKPKQEQIIKERENSKEFTIYNNGTATDNKTNLNWMRCALGQTWKGKTCTGKAKKYTWKKAEDIAKTTNFAGKFNWRLPTIKELNTIVYCSNGKQIKFTKDGYSSNILHEGFLDCYSNITGDYKKPTINSLVFPNTSIKSFWSSTPHAHHSTHSWIVNFNNGRDFYTNYKMNYQYFDPKGVYNKVRLVRLAE